MKVKELIEQLNKLNPELEVYVEADHGQLPEQCHGAQENYLKELDKNGSLPYYAEDSVQVEDINAHYIEDYFEGWTKEEIEALPKIALVYA